MQATTGHHIQRKRIYEPVARDDGVRVLVDRLWPRGLSKAEAKLDVWLKEVAPSAALRKWFGHEASRWTEFRKRYEAELDGNPDVERLAKMADGGPVTLLYGARDEDHNQAVVLADYLQKRLEEQ